MKFKLLLIILCLFTLSAFTQTKEAQKFDEFGNISCDDLIARLDNLFLELKKSPDAKAYIIVYEGKLKTTNYDKNAKFLGYKYILPTFGDANLKIRTMKTRMMFSRHPAENAVFIKGGFRENYVVEFWIVPSGAALPKPTPTLKKMKYRKGKSTDICGEF